ncbi:MAG: S8 family serine peptidase [bacterium]|nr:S8 family serine peptidase [bacterium]
MKKVFVILTAFCLLALAGPGRAENNRATTNPYLKGVVIFKLKTHPVLDAKGFSCGVPQVDDVLQQHGLDKLKMLYPHKSLAKSNSGQGLSRICQAKVSGTADIMALCTQLKNTGQVEYAEPRYGYKMETTTPNDPSYGSQWFLGKIQAGDAWDISTGDTTVWIGIVDCGVQVTHPDLAANIWINPVEDINHNGKLDNWPSTYDSLGVFGDIDSLDNDGNGYKDDIRGWDFAGPDIAVTAPAGDNDPNVYDDNNDHGTHVAGDASAVTNNGTGVSGIGWSCKAMAIKCSYDNDYTATGGKSYIYFGYDGIAYAAENGAKVINCSWGGSGYSQFAQDIINYAWEAGSVIVCAAGNDAVSAPHYPSAYNNVVSVAATTSLDAKSSFSNYGTTIDVSAPGSAILSTAYSNSYDSWDGTSMASPVAAGVAGLIWANNPTWNNTQVATQLIMTTDNIDALNPAYAGLLGTGRINAYKALTVTPVPLVKYQSHLVTDGGNGIAEAGESVFLSLSLKNWWGDAASVSAAIHSTDYAVTINTSTAGYGAINGGFTNSVSSFDFTVDNTALPHWAMFIVDITADAESRTDTFYVQIERSPILLLDDDTGARNVDTLYSKSISKLGYFYDRYDRSQRGAPDTSLLKSYNTVIWLCEWASPTLDSMDRAALRTFLDQGGNLYLSGQDIGWDLADPTGLPDNQYNAETEAFYQDYLHATYGGDHSAITSILGVTGDPISNGLAFSILQPYGISQYYDYFTPRAGADSILRYSGFTSGLAGVKYSGAYKVIYTGFGFEAITSETVRDTVMDRMVKWFMGDIQIAHTPLTDTEDTLSPYLVQTTVTSSAGVAQVYLYWDDDGTLPYANRTLMTDMGGGLYQASIPAHSGARIDYFIYALNNNGLNKTLPGGAPYNYYSFYAGPDPYAPVITHNTLTNTINLSGPYKASATITDNYGVFPDSGYIHYKVNSGSEYPPVQMTSVGSSFSGNIILPAHLYTGDTVYYYITAVDTSSMHNTGRSPASGYHSFVTVDSALVTNFDSPAMLALFDTLAGTNPWRTYITGPRSAPNCMRTGTTNYPVNSSLVLQLKTDYGYNLDAYADNSRWVNLYMWSKGIIGAGDSAFVEASKDGSTWTTLKARTSLKSSWALDTIAVNPIFSTKGSNDSILFRMRLKSDAATTAFGWVVDDVYLKVQPVLGITGGLPGTLKPLVLALFQNNPNPFGAGTTISYQLPAENRVALKVYNVAGQLVRTLVNSKQPAGSYSVKWDGRDDGRRQLAAGVYLYRLEAGESRFTKKLVMIK